MVSISYILPLAVAIGASSSQPYQWKDGYLATIAREIAGPWLETWMIFAAGVSNIAMFQAELSADAFQLMGMADRGHVPKIFTHRSVHGTPTYGILLGTFIIVLMGASGLDKLIEMLNFNYAISLLMEYTAFLKLRIYHPELNRPWKIPFGTVGCIIFFLPTYFFILLVLALYMR
jgi:amino acid transporter